MRKRDHFDPTMLNPVVQGRAVVPVAKGPLAILRQCQRCRMLMPRDTAYTHSDDKLCTECMRQPNPKHTDYIAMARGYSLTAKAKALLATWRTG